MREAVAIHALYAPVAALVLAVPAGVGVGTRLTVAVAGYVLWLPVAAGTLGATEVVAAWRFGVVVSILQVIPDWVLVQGLGTLRFHPEGAPSVGPIPVYMAGLWTLPVVVIVLVGVAVEARSGPATAVATVAAVAAALFAGAEALLPHLPTWEPVGVSRWGTVAAYVVPAEVVFGVVVYATYRWVRAGSWWRDCGGAAAVMVTYAGALSVSWVVVERIIA